MSNKSNTDIRKFITHMDLSHNAYALSSQLPIDNTKNLDYLSKYENLNLLRLNNCNLTNIPNSICKLKNLEYLTINKNQIRSLRDGIHKCNKNLKWIVARHNRLTSDGVDKLPSLSNLSVIDLSHNHLMYIPKEIGSVDNLTVLNLSHNSIRIIPKSLFNELTNLLHLDISNNCLETIPDTVKNLKRLHTLSLANNSTLSGEHLGVLVYLRSLESLHLGNTDRCLGGIPDLRHLDFLTNLDLSKNSLVNVPSHVYELQKLLNLNLSDNCLSSLSNKESVQIKWENLRILNLSRNKLTVLPDNLFACIPSIRRFYCNANLLTFESLPLGFDRLVKLENLYLAANKLQTLPESISRCPSLKYIDVSDNPIVCYPVCLKKFSNVKPLDKPTDTKLTLSNFNQIKFESNEDLSVFSNDLTNIKDLHCYCIVNFNPVRIDVPSVLLKGECYIFLKITDQSTTGNDDDSIKCYDIHIWCGSEAPIDKKGTIAFYAVQLSRKIKQSGIKKSYRSFRHEEGSESDSFWQIFTMPPDVQQGNLTNSALFNVNTSLDNICICSYQRCDEQSKQCIQMYNVNFSNPLQSKGHLWALRVPLFKQYMQPKNTLLMRIKKRRNTNEQNSTDALMIWYGGKNSDFVELSEGYDKEFVKIFDNLSEFKNALNNKKTLTTPTIRDIVIYKVIIKEGKIKVEQVRSFQGPSVFIIDCNTIMYIWHGRCCNHLERMAASRLCDELQLIIPRLCDRIPVLVEPEGSESFLFRQIFEIKQNLPKDKRTSSNKKNEKPIVKEELKIKNPIFNTSTTNGYTIDMSNLNDLEKVDGFEIQTSENPRLLSSTDTGRFRSNCSYVYIVKSKVKTKVYFWQGALVRTNKSWFIFNIYLRKQIERLFNQISILRVYQQREPYEFLQLFNNRMIIYSIPRKKRIFQVVMNKKPYYTIELNCIEELCPHSAYMVLYSSSNKDIVLYLWYNGCCDKTILEMIAHSLLPHLNYCVEKIGHNTEPDQFWIALGGKKPLMPRRNHDRRMFKCSIVLNQFTMHEPSRSDFCKSIFDNEHVILLDDGLDTLFVWIGSKASKNLTINAIKAAYIYIGRCQENSANYKMYPKATSNSLKRIRFTCTNAEPIEFRRCFINWTLNEN